MIKEIKAYMLSCNKCGSLFEDGDFTIFETEEQALDCAINYEWSIDDDRHLCEGCRDD